MDITNLSIDALIPYVNNSRTHDDNQVNQIAASIKEFGFNNPVLVDEHKSVIAGHGRVLAARKLGIDSIPCVTLSHLTENQKKAYIIADNKLALNAGWDDSLLSLEINELIDNDFNIDLLGFDEDEIKALVNLSELDPQSEGDDIPDSTVDPITKIGDVWLLGEHRVMCGDSTNVDDVNKLLSGKKIDLIFSDPPYGVSYADKNKLLNSLDKGNRIQKDIKNDHLNIADIEILWRDVFSLWSTFFNEYSSFYVASPQGGDLLLMKTLNENGFNIKHMIIWNKNNHVLGRCDYNYNYKHEPILYGWKNKHKFYGKGQYKTSVWDIAKPEKSDLHPTMKPVELVENCILNSSVKGQLVADMFLGSGTTLIASEKNQRVCYGMELDESYCDVIVKRWQDYTGKKATLESTGEYFNG